MLFWITAAVLTFAVALALLVPLWRGNRQATSDTVGDAAGEEAVYRDQLKELERDKADGLISEEEAASARAEIGRRLLAVAGKSAEKAAATRSRGHLLAQAFVLLCLPAIGLGLYLRTGTPGLDAQPLAARLENPGNNVELLVAKVERHLAQNPNDGSGWDILAPIYVRMNRAGDAELAYRNAIRLLGTSPARMNGLGEVLIAASGGIVTDDARSAFEEALRLDPKDPQARFYVALALEQAGRRDEARAAYEALAKDSPKDAPWIALVNEHIAATGGAPLADAAPAPAAPGNPTGEDIAAAEQMSSDDRNTMIRGMVESLDARLKEDPNNFEGWMRLVRSYAMLKEPESAIGALKRGLVAFPADGEQGRQLVAMARELGLPVEEALK
jgi:cytochrome c-type biogenesis protein CcmI